MGDPHRFRHGTQFRALTGLVPKVSQTKDLMRNLPPLLGPTPAADLLGHPVAVSDDGPGLLGVDGARAGLASSGCGRFRSHPWSDTGPYPVTLSARGPQRGNGSPVTDAVCRRPDRPALSVLGKAGSVDPTQGPVIRIRRLLRRKINNRSRRCQRCFRGRRGLPLTLDGQGYGHPGHDRSHVQRSASSQAPSTRRRNGRTHTT